MRFCGITFIRMMMGRKTGMSSKLQPEVKGCQPFSGLLLGQLSLLHAAGIRKGLIQALQAGSGKTFALIIHITMTSMITNVLFVAHGFESRAWYARTAASVSKERKKMILNSMKR